MARAKESNKQAILRFQDLMIIQEAYPNFPDFFKDGVKEVYGFDATEVQLDICYNVQNGGLQRMIQAQRGQAKTTIAIFYGIWRLIHNPSTRILVICAGSGLASDITNGMLQVIYSWNILSILIPDAQAGDRTSATKFDIHHSLRNADKTASVSATSVTSQIQGLRADLAIGDDVESFVNSQTQAMRDKLKVAINNISDICVTGDILFLGTPQSTKSVYRNFSHVGVDVYIYPARVPSESLMTVYGDSLAPYVVNMLDTHKRTGFGLSKDLGEPVDPFMFDEEKLLNKERVQGRSHFQLQYLLDPSLVDSSRCPLDASDLIITYGNHKDSLPVSLEYSEQLCNLVNGIEHDTKFFYANRSQSQNPVDTVSDSYLHEETYHEKVMYIDPSGKGTDETVALIVGRLFDQIHIIDFVTSRDGFNETTLDGIIALYTRYKPHRVAVESNMGDGMFSSLLSIRFSKRGVDRPYLEEVKVYSNKESRIIDTLEPLLSRHAISMPVRLLQRDLESETNYSLIYQINGIMRIKNALAHDDRIDTLVGAISMLNKDALSVIPQDKINKDKEIVEMFNEMRKGSKKRNKSRRKTGSGTMGARRIVSRIK